MDWPPESLYVNSTENLYAVHDALLLFPCLLTPALEIAVSIHTSKHLVHVLGPFAEFCFSSSSARELMELNQLAYLLEQVVVVVSG